MFYNPARIIFGRNALSSMPNEIRRWGSRILLVYGNGSVKKNGVYNKVTAVLKEAGLFFIELSGIHANPLLGKVREGIELCKQENLDFILAMGGGSVIDTAKAIALALANNGEYWKFYNGVPAEKMVPVGTVHTISAAGSETSRSSVLVDDLETGRKQGFNWDCCRPVFAIMNPELTYTLPAYQTAAGASDIVAHTVSRYFTKNVPTCRLGDEFCEGLIRTVIKYGPIAIAKPNDYEARAELMMAASFSHNDLTWIGRTGPRGGEHALEHQLSGHYDTVHGAGLAAVMPAWLQYIVDNGTPELVARIAQFGVSIFGVRADMADIKATANAGLEAFRAWVRSIGMPLTLKELGIPGAELPQVIKRTADANNGKIVGFMDLDEKAIAAIFTSMAE